MLVRILSQMWGHNVLFWPAIDAFFFIIVSNSIIIRPNVGAVNPLLAVLSLYANETDLNTLTVTILKSSGIRVTIHDIVALTVQARWLPLHFTVELIIKNIRTVLL